MVAGYLFWRCVLRLFPSRWFPLLILAAMSGAAVAQSGTPKLQLGGYEQALRLMEQGDCASAEEKLLPSGRAAPGDEVAMSDIGNCYIRAAAKINDPDVAQRSRELGAGWILVAANLGVRRAQEEAVRLYLDGRIFMADPYEAGKWYLVWSGNRSQMQLGQIEFDTDLLKQMNSGFTPDQWAEAKARAAKWRPVTLPSRTTAP
jgi:hypothetical protein